MSAISTLAVGVPHLKQFHLHVFGTGLDSVPLSKWNQVNVGQLVSVSPDPVSPSTHVTLTILAPAHLVMVAGPNLNPDDEGIAHEKTEHKGEFGVHKDDTASVTLLSLSVNGGPSTLPIVIE